jgi:ABC-type polysaccharide/polyol phosphate transport system ATPase subunit
MSGAPTLLDLVGVSVSFRPLTRRGWGRPGASRWALRDVSLSVSRGEIVGVIGGNGSGKTTLLHTASGVFVPAAGTVKREATSSLIDLSLGAGRDLTAFEYLRVMTPLLGYRWRDIVGKLDDIVEFSGLTEDVLDQPMRSYSAGMVLRVAFALAIHLPFEVFLLDEVLAVGDAEFQHRCLERLRTKVDHGFGVLLATHDEDVVADWCDRVGLLERGQLTHLGAPTDALSWFKSGTWAD